ncbi:MAG: hypothetical protein EU529_06820 [Promethearchaeota archaeon]|nr:MAG: hypothetical protein EU529_06820 [Candidatus Lokiarchaeota archaeon]
MANTTIQISERTKNKLFELINKLEKKWGRRVTYDEAIEFLVKEKGYEVKKENFLNNIKQFQGILKPKEGTSIFKEMRRNELDREERFTK